MESSLHFWHFFFLSYQKVWKVFLLTHFPHAAILWLSVIFPFILSCSFLVVTITVYLINTVKTLDMCECFPRPVPSNRGSSMNTFGAVNFVTPVCLIFCSLSSVKRWGDRLKVGMFFNALINVTVIQPRPLWCETDTLRVSPMLREKGWCADGETASSSWWGFANDGPASVSSLLCPVKRLTLWTSNI